MKAEQNPTVEQARQLLASEEGRKLLALLSQGGGKELRRAAEEFQKGNMGGAQAALDAVALYAVALFFAHGNSNPAVPAPARRHDYGEQPVRGGFANTIGIAEFFFFLQSILAFHNSNSGSP